ncbi:MAG: polymerase sigma factor [Bacteriovoracaceae bacterium]|nr:polymerase sigma factor [Bacteriovoracaceae bacterium]
MKTPQKKPRAKKVEKERALPAKTQSLVPIPAESTGKGEALQNYLTSIKTYPLLNAEKELEVATKYKKTQDPDSAQLLILSNLRLVVKIAYDYARAGIHILDLIQEGNIGLLQAVKEFDPYKGVKLSSYASYWIKAYIRAFILKNWSLVKMGTTRAQRSLFYKLQKEKNRLELLGIAPEPKYLAEKLQVKEREVIEMSQRLGGKDISLNAPLFDDEGETLLQSVRDTSVGADEQLATKEVQDEFTERLNAFERTLSGKELLIFRERLRSEEPKTLQEIGDSYHITRERVRQIESRVMEKLKEYMKEHARFLKRTIDVPKNS